MQLGQFALHLASTLPSKPFFGLGKLLPELLRSTCRYTQRDMQTQLAVSHYSERREAMDGAPVYVSLRQLYEYACARVNLCSDSWRIEQEQVWVSTTLCSDHHCSHALFPGVVQP